MYTEMPKSSTRAMLPAATSIPEYNAAGATLHSRTRNNPTIAAPNAVGRNSHSRSRTSPAHTPSAATASAGCGPVSPSANGSGGNSNAHTKKIAIQRRSEKIVQNTAGASSTGADNAILSEVFGASATAAA